MPSVDFSKIKNQKIQLESVKSKSVDGPAPEYLLTYDQPPVGSSAVIVLADTCSFKKSWSSSLDATAWVDLCFAPKPGAYFVRWRWKFKTAKNEYFEGYRDYNTLLDPQQAMDAYINFIQWVLNRDYTLLLRQGVQWSPASLAYIPTQSNSTVKSTSRLEPQPCVKEPPKVLARQGEKDWGW
jgi:hypothetical protein